MRSCAGLFGNSKKCKFICITLFLVAAKPLSAWADGLLLFHGDIQGKVGKRWETKVDVETKYRANMWEYYDFEAMPWAAYRFTDWFKFGMGWRYLRVRKNQVNDHSWQSEHRPLADFMFTMKPGIWTVEERFRVEHREIEDQDPYFRFRNRIRVRPPWKWTKAGIKPWVAWEMYYDHDHHIIPSQRISQHRFYVGLGAKLTQRLNVGWYYYYADIIKNKSWKSNNEIGVEMSFIAF